MELKRYKDFIKESKEEKDLWTYEGDFKVDKSMVENGKFIKDKIPDIVKGNFDCRNNKLTSLEGGPEKIGRSFFCNNNQLTSLEGGPEEVGGFFSCETNLLTSLKGGPMEIGYNIACRGNQLTSLEGVPKKIRGQVYVYSYLKIENDFVNTGIYINNYWEDLLKYMINNKIDLKEVEGWPEGFLTKETIKSAKGISKFNL